MMNFLDEIDQKFSQEEIDEKDLEGIKDFLRQRGSLFPYSSPLTSDGELTREVAMLLN